MNIAFFISLGIFLICFLSTLVGLRIILSKVENEPLPASWRQDAFLPVLTVTIIAFVLLFFFGNNPQDQIFQLSVTEFGIVLIASIFLYVSFFLKNSFIISLIFLTALTTICTLLMPKDFSLFQNSLPFWVDRLCIIVLWTAFSWFFRYLNGIDGIAALQASNQLLGLFLVSILGGLPLLYGNFCAAFLGAVTALLIYTWYPSKLPLKDGSCTTLGFLSGWILLLSAQEGMKGCSLILITYYILEIFWATGNKLISDKGKFVANTLYYQTNVSGMSPALTCQSIYKLFIVLLVLSCFQVYAPNNYSLPLASALITLWFMNKLHNWQNQPQSFSEINREVIQDIKNNVDDIKKIIR